jgi:hypothetical protein
MQPKVLAVFCGAGILPAVFVCARKMPQDCPSHNDSRTGHNPAKILI